MLSGIDVSYWQGSVDWPTVRQTGVTFAYARASQSNNYADPTFGPNVIGAQKVGILAGAYHFFQFAAPAQAQAKWFLAQIAPYQLDLPTALDVEDTTTMNKAAAAVAIKTWLDLVEQGTGFRPIIYTNANSWDTYVGAPAWVGNYKLWIANWTAGAEPFKPKCWTNWTIWQHTNQGQVAGINNHVDQDRCNLSKDDLLALTGKQDKTPQPNGKLEDRVAALEQTLQSIKDALKAKAIL